MSLRCSLKQIKCLFKVKNVLEQNFLQKKNITKSISNLRGDFFSRCLRPGRRLIGCKYPSRRKMTSSDPLLSCPLSCLSRNRLPTFLLSFCDVIIT